MNESNFETQYATELQEAKENAFVFDPKVVLQTQESISVFDYASKNPYASNN